MSDHTAVGGVDRPLLTYCDDATGERVELTAAALGGWASRTAALLTQDCGLGPGARVVTLLPPHWQTAAVLLGAWSAGLSVSFRLTATAGLPRHEGEDAGPFDAVFAAYHRWDDWLEDVPAARHRFILGLAPHGAPSAQVPAGYRDYVTEVVRYTDSLPAAPIGDTATPMDGATFRQWGDLAATMAERYGLHPGARLLVHSASDDHPVKWLLAPLAAGASVVVCANLRPADVATRAAAEGATRVL